MTLQMEKFFCSGCYNSKHGPKVYGFGSSGGESGSGLDVSKQSEKIEDFKKTPESKTVSISKSNTSDTSKLQASKFSNSNMCVNCGKKVFENERVSAHSYVFHDTCFKCMNCSKRMTLGKTNDTPDGKVLCSVCYNSKHGPKVYGFGSSSGESGSGLDISKQSEKKETQQSEKKGGSSDLEALEKLAALKNKGIITEEEFNAKKKQILGI